MFNSFVISFLHTHIPFAFHSMTTTTNSDYSNSIEELPKLGNYGSHVSLKANGSRKTKTMQDISKVDNDPFAGMNTVVDYQQEIERLKIALAQTAPKAKRSETPLPRTSNCHTQDSSSIEIIEPVVSQAEQERFFAFMRMWTGGSQRWNNCSRCF
ncbi:hypothetical protein INT43_004812 [Umbelopsis isabellina]|uniref:Uncharacterized protein n=1 Tax=Mortierella isabellina TaxID=91625 RepID=A0A8H7PE69_MORIS|nr:hypothetical protein INT43_004812 [Umbelopsis isabellina]